MVCLLSCLLFVFERHWKSSGDVKLSPGRAEREKTRGSRVEKRAYGKHAVQSKDSQGRMFKFIILFLFVPFMPLFTGGVQSSCSQ